MNKDYYTTDGYQSPRRRVDSGARMAAVGILLVVLVIGALMLWG